MVRNDLGKQRSIDQRAAYEKNKFSKSLTRIMCHNGGDFMFSIAWEHDLIIIQRAVNCL
jgi:hypothetical protein